MKKSSSSKSKDYYSDFKKICDEYFERMKTEYLLAVDKAEVKMAGHNVFEQRKMRSESQRLQKELGIFSSFMNGLRNEKELDKDITIQEMFNLKIAESEPDKRAAILKPLAEYEGLDLMYKFWHRRKDYVRIFYEPLEHPLEALIHIEKNFAESFASVNRERERSFVLMLERRTDNEEKIYFTRKEINAARNKIESDLLYKFYNFLNQNPENFGEIIGYNWQNYNHVLTAFFGDKQEQGNEAIKMLLNHAFESGEKSQEEISGLLKSLKERGIESHALNNALSGQYKNYEHRFLYIQFYFYYEIQFLNFLIKKLQELQQPKIEPTETTLYDKDRNKEFTTRRQVLAVYYIMDALNIYGKADKTEIARFIQFLTGKETGAKEIQNTTIYKMLKQPLNKDEKNLEDNLRFIRTYFEKLSLQGIVEKINKEIGSKE